MSDNNSMEVVKKTLSERKSLGMFFTPLWLVDYMIGLIDINGIPYDRLKVLEPACGNCQFLRRIRDKFKYLAMDCVGVEVDKDIVEYSLEQGYLERGFEVIVGDYLVWDSSDKFDVIIGNPPYGIPSPSEHYSIRVTSSIRKQYRKLYQTWYGKYNVYGAFIEKSVKLLKPQGQLVFVVPSTFMILDEFKKLRYFLSNMGKTQIIYLGSNVFKPEVEVSTVVLKFTKSESEKHLLSLFEYKDGETRLLWKNMNWKGELVLFSTDFSKRLENMCSFRLGQVFDIKISPRTPEVKNNPEIIKMLISSDQMSDGKIVPILNSRNLGVKVISYRPLSGYWIEFGKREKLRKFFKDPHIVVGIGYRGNGNLAIAYDHCAYPWMGDVYHLIRKSNLINSEFDLTDYEVVDFLSSSLVSKYIKDVFRDITYHLSISQLMIIPLPTRRELRVIIRELI